MTTHPEDAGTSPAPSEPTPTKPLAASSRSLLLMWVLSGTALLLAAVSMAYALYLQQQLTQSTSQLGKQTQALEQQYNTANSHNAHVQAKALLLEQRVGTLEAQRTQIELMSRSLSAAKEQTLLADLRTTLQLGQQYAHLSGNAQPLLDALVNANKRLQAANEPNFAALQYAIEQDIARFKAARLMDMPLLINKLDGLLLRLDALPLQGKQIPVLTPKTVTRPVDTANASRWLRLWHDARDSVMQLVRVRNIGSTEVAGLSSEQAAAVREHLRMRLLNARVALLTRQIDAARRDLDAAQALLKTYFENDAALVKSSSNILDEINRLSKDSELPSISNSLTALANSSATGK